MRFYSLWPLRNNPFGLQVKMIAHIKKSCLLFSTLYKSSGSCIDWC